MQYTLFEAFHLLAHIEDGWGRCALEGHRGGGGDLEHGLRLCLSDGIAAELGIPRVLTLGAIQSCLILWPYLCDSRRDGIGNLGLRSYWIKMKLFLDTLYISTCKNSQSPIMFEVSIALFLVHSFVLGPRSFLSVVKQNESVVMVRVNVSVVYKWRNDSLFICSTLNNWTWW